MRRFRRQQRAPEPPPAAPVKMVWRNGGRTMTVAPHIDPTVLHAPGTCDPCDLFPTWQMYREIARINFTDQGDPGRAPCPSTYFDVAPGQSPWSADGRPR